MVDTSCKKSTQAINYFACKKDGRINKLKAIKLIWLADRYHLRKYGRPVIGDTYWAMQFGPVGSKTLDIANLKDSLEKDCLKYASSFLKSTGESENTRNLSSKKDVDLGVFSQTDIEALEMAFAEYGDRDRFELAEISHVFPEWARHRDDLCSGKVKRVMMDYLDFFSHSKISNIGIFNQDIEHLKETKEIFKENLEISRVLS